MTYVTRIKLYQRHEEGAARSYLPSTPINMPDFVKSGTAQVGAAQPISGIPRGREIRQNF